MVRMRTATEPLESGLRAMTRFFFHVRTPSLAGQDSEGEDFPNLDAARQEQS